MNHDVRPKLQRALEKGAHKGVIDHQANPAPPRYFGNRANVYKGHHRVSRRFDENHSSFSSRCFFDIVRLACINVAKLEPKVPQNFVEQAKRATVGVIADDDVIAPFEQRHHRIGGRHSGRECEARSATFERRQVLLECHPSRVLSPRVLEAFVLTQPFLGVG